MQTTNRLPPCEEAKATLPCQCIYIDTVETLYTARSGVLALVYYSTLYALISTVRPSLYATMILCKLGSTSDPASFAAK